MPKLVGLVEKAGLRIRLIDVDDPDSKQLCTHVRWVPYIEYNGSELSIQEFLQLVSELTEEED